MNVIAEARKFAQKVKSAISTPKWSTDVLLPRAERRRRSVHAATIPENIAVQNRDGMPQEVAEAMLFTPGTKLTNAMRKNCMAARETVFVSTREGKEYSVRLKARAKQASALQLVKWAQRVAGQRAQCTRDFLKLSIQKSKLDPLKLHEIARANRMLSLIDIKAQQLDLQMASYRSEAERRLVNNHVFEPVSNMPAEFKFHLLKPGSNVHVLHDNEIIVGELDSVKIIGIGPSYNPSWKVIYTVGNIGCRSAEFPPHRVAETKEELLKQL